MGMYFSDFCMSPMDSVYRSMSGLGLIQQTAKHYGFCKGLNPIHRNLAESYLIRDGIGNELVSLFDYNTNQQCECRSDLNTIDAFRALQDMHDIYETLSYLMDCPTVHYKWMKIYELALCHNTMTGLMALYLTGILTCIGLFLVSIAASVLILYFGENWDLVGNAQQQVDAIKAKHEKSAKYAKLSSSDSSKTASLTKEDKFDAFGNKIEEKQAKKKIPKSELKKIKKRVADLRKKGQEVWTDEEIEKEGYEIPV